MASKKKGPRQILGLKCTLSGVVNYVITVNKNNIQLKGKTLKDLKFMKYCPTLQKHTEHVTVTKLK